MLGFSFLKQSNIPKSLLASALVVDVDFALIISSAYFPPFKLSFSILLETTKKDPKINSRHWIQLWWIFSLGCTSILNWSSLCTGSGKSDSSPFTNKVQSEAHFSNKTNIHWQWADMFKTVFSVSNFCHTGPATNCG